MSGTKRKRAGRKASRGAAKAVHLGRSLGAFIPGAGRQISAPARHVFRRLSLKTRLLLGIPAAMLAMAALAVTGLLISYNLTMPDPLTLRSNVSGPAIRVLARDGSLLAERGVAHDYIPLDMLPARVVNAVVATEDRRFWSHWGIDPAGLGRAVFANLRAGRIAQGGSTLTQQLAKNLFLTPERTLRRKVDELVLALWLELRLSKQDILELYLNRVYFGGGAYGIEAAAQRYFDKSARAMTLAEAAVVAGLLKAPSRYAPTSNPRLARARGHNVLSKMRDAGFITARDEQTARMTRLTFANSKIDARRNATDYAVDFALERMPPVLGTDHGEVIVETTLDRELQAEASRVVAAEVASQGKALAASQAALVILDTTGGVRAMVGGASYAKSQFNRAVKARRQPGSAFKPFVYLAALEKGYTPESVAYDLPFNLQGWSPKNDNGRFSGPVTLRHALTQSINTVAVRLMMDAGPDRVASLAARLGIESDLRTDPSLALGTSEVSLLELTGAYGTFAAGGIGVEPHVVRRIRSSRGRILYARPAPSADQLATPMAVAQLNDMMQSVVANGTGRRAAIEGHETAGKTGTSQEFRDAWFIGYTAQFAGGVWVGNDNGQPMRKVTGGNLPAQIWHKVMTRAHAGLPPRPLPGSTLTPELLAQRMTGAPRGESAELLPWQMPTKVPPRPAPKRTPAPQAKATAVPPAYPKERISGDFLARVLDETPDSTAAAMPAARGTGDGTQASSDRKPVLPGMMSLGAALR